MPLHLAHHALPGLRWSKPRKAASPAHQADCDRGTADQRAYVRAFAAPMIPVAVLAAVSLVAASYAAG